jgi:hypothetical protein
MPWMYCNAMTTRLFVGMLTPAMRAIRPLHVVRAVQARGMLFARPVEAGPCAVCRKGKGPDRLLSKPSRTSCLERERAP